jgi:hypothetical protein
MTYVGRPTVGWILFGVITIAAVAVSVSTADGVASGNELGVTGIGFVALLWLLAAGSLVFSIALTVGRARYVAATTLSERAQHRAEAKNRGMSKPVDYGQRIDGKEGL